MVGINSCYSVHLLIENNILIYEVVLHLFSNFNIYTSLEIYMAILYKVGVTFASYFISGIMNR